ELDLDAEPHTSTHVAAAAQHGNTRYTHAVFEPLLKRADLHGLPLAMGTDCQLGKESAQSLQALSRKLRAHLSQCTSTNFANENPHLVAGQLRHTLLQGGADSDWLQEDALPTMSQMLQVEDRPARLLLVELLTKIEGRASSAALARRAVFDLAPDV